MNILIDLYFYLEYAFWFILVFTIIVFIHEFGHFYIARLNGVKVERFSIGFGPPLLKYSDKNQTLWQICALPLGGYVKFAGEMYPTKIKDKKERFKKELFMNKTALQKASIVLAGPIANFFLGVLLFMIIFIFYGKNHTNPVIGNIEKNSPAEKAGILKYDKILAINGNNINSFEEVSNLLEDALFTKVTVSIERTNNIYDIEIYPETKTVQTFIGSKRQINYLGLQPILKPIVSKVLDNSPAELGGLKTKDKIIEIDGMKILDIKEVIAIVENNIGNKLDFIVLRNLEYINLSITPKSVINQSGKEKGVIGITFSRDRKKINFFKSIKESFKNFFVIIYKTLIAFSEIVFGKRDHCEVGGPILIAKVSNEIGSQDLHSFFSLLAIISINLGLINLFPLPLLDGGHFFTYMYEFIYKKKVTKVFYKYFQSIGALLVIALMFFSVFNDIYCRVLN